MLSINVTRKAPNMLPRLTILEPNRDTEALLGEGRFLEETIGCPLNAMLNFVLVFQHIGHVVGL